MDGHSAWGPGARLCLCQGCSLPAGLLPALGRPLTGFCGGITSKTVNDPNSQGWLGNGYFSTKHPRPAFVMVIQEPLTYESNKLPSTENLRGMYLGHSPNHDLDLVVL